MSENLKSVCGLGSVYTVVTRCCNKMGAKTAVRVLLCSKNRISAVYDALHA